MSTMISVYRFAKLVGRNPQQFYGMIQNGSFPQELYRYEQVGDRQQPMVDLEAAQEWFANRQQGKVAQKPEELFKEVLEMIEDKRLQASLQKYFEKKYGSQ